MQEHNCLVVDFESLGMGTRPTLFADCRLQIAALIVFSTPRNHNLYASEGAAYLHPPASSLLPTLAALRHAGALSEVGDLL